MYIYIYIHTHYICVYLDARAKHALPASKWRCKKGPTRRVLDICISLSVYISLYMI